MPRHFDQPNSIEIQSGPGIGCAWHACFQLMAPLVHPLYTMFLLFNAQPLSPQAAKIKFNPWECPRLLGSDVLQKHVALQTPPADH